ncbi:hypothetical protein [Flagellimonas halotolerans]|uniref:Uncharacterized protein n=1 Tax=Flagellimonas halotolerans TaxID=3112164 RepID=A0ABU6IMZ9_9FLAO|nr:hypothetical protein [Muricauda sp. SYSU M86414]MEC3964621.1 hypothetical protein [Muricauda sp. SYSU M86414]MEC4264490.1 hypothetical protein [Muricauda sp. SYSU M84420]
MKKKIEYWLYKLTIYLLVVFILGDILILLNYLFTVAGVMERKYEDLNHTALWAGAITFVLIIVEYILRKLK